MERADNNSIEQANGDEAAEELEVFENSDSVATH